MAVCAATASRADAQPLPEGPIRALDGRVAVSGEVVATLGSLDEVAWFNYTDYEHNALRMVRLGLAASWRPAQWLAFVGEVRSEDFELPGAYAAYVRVRPWRRYALDIQAGRIPPTFGAFSRHAYGTDNPVIGYPLAYQYLTSLRTDAVPGTADDLLGMRARGWRSSFPIGSQTPGPGVPLITAFRWDTGVQVRWKQGPIEVSSAITNGTLSNPRLRDDNGGKQLAGRVVLTPAVGWIMGVSGARGAWLAREIPSQTTPPLQRVLGSRRGILARPLDRAWRAGLEPLVVSRPALAVQLRDRRRAGDVGRRALPHHAAPVPRRPRRPVDLHAGCAGACRARARCRGTPPSRGSRRGPACTCSATSC